MTNKVKRGRPAGVKDSYRRKRATNKQLIKVAEKDGKLTATYIKLMDQLREMEAQNTLVAQKFSTEKKELIKSIKHQRGVAVETARSLRDLANDGEKRIRINAAIPIELGIMFQEVIDHSPFTKTEVLTNLVLNFVKAYRGLGQNELDRLRNARLEVEKRQYDATVVAANFMAKNPEQIISHEDITKGKGRRKIAGAIHEEHDTYRRYAEEGTKPMNDTDIQKALNQSGFVTYDDLWGNET